MQEHSKREELLNEELLEWVTGASGNGHASTSKLPRPGSFLHCQECKTAAWWYNHHISRRDRVQVDVDSAVAQGSLVSADQHLQLSQQYHEWAQARYAQMEAHGHPDFPAALRQQRRNYNPPN